MSETFIGRDGQRLGPYDDDTLRRMAAAGQLYESDYGWPAGASEWQPLASVLAAKGLTATLLPPPPPSTNAGSPGEMAGYMSRLAANFIDGIVSWLVFIGIYVLIFVIMSLAQPASADNTGSALAVGFGYLAGYALFAYWQGGSKMATPGKRAAGLIVVTRDGQPLGFWRALGRQLLLSLTCAFFLPMFVLFFTQRRQMLHDFVVGSVVVRKASFSRESFDIERLKKPEGDGGGAIAVVVLLFGLIVIGGILAAIAIPAYQDYVTRAKVSVAIAEVTPLQIAVGRALAESGRVESYEALGLDGPVALSGGAGTVNIAPNGNIVITFEPRPLHGRILVLSPQDGHWDCKGGDLPTKYRPSNCR